MSNEPQDHASAVQALKAALITARPDWKGRIWVRMTDNQITVTVRKYRSLVWWPDDGEWWHDRWHHTFAQIAAEVLDELTDHEGRAWASSAR